MPGMGMFNCVHDSGYIAGASRQAGAMTSRAAADAAIQIAIYAANRDLAVRISNAQNDIANRQMILAEAIHAHVKNFWPEEIAFVDDAFGEQKHQAQYDAQALVWGELAEEALDTGREDWEREADALCLRIASCHRSRWQRFKAMTKADVETYAMRQEESKEQVLNDRRYARQLAALGLGRDRIGTAASFTAIGGSIRTGAAQMLAGAVNSGFQALGYSMARQATPDPWSERTWSSLTGGTMGYNADTTVNAPPVQVPNLQANPFLARPETSGPTTKMEAGAPEER